MEYIDLSLSFQKLMTIWHDHSEYFDQYIPAILGGQKKRDEVKNTKSKRRPLDLTLLSVRPSICVTGLHWLSLQQVKRTVSDLIPNNVPVESLHIKSPGDVKDGALLVPKVLLVARHCPGRKVIDDDGDSGQLDYIYDEVCELGADVFVVYLGLPRAIYTPMKNMVYHPRLIDLVFPGQPTLRRLAEDNLLVTLIEGQDDFTFMQKNVLREWLEKPVGENHPVYQAADYLSSAEIETYGFRHNFDAPQVNFYSETEVVARKRSDESAKEEKPKKKKKERKKLFRGNRNGYQALPQNDLMDFEDSSNQHDTIEMEIYTGQNNNIPSMSF